MNTALKIEEAAIMAIPIFFLGTLQLHIYWWLWPVLFLAPDISMLGYLGGTKSGAFFYNLFHHKTAAITVIMAGYLLHNEYLLLTGWLLLGHSSFDRMLGYGLKYNDGFGHTHLGTTGKKA